MCDPFSIGLGLISTAASVQGQRAAAKQQEIAQDRASEQERQRQVKEMSSMRTKQRLEQIAVSQKLQLNTLKAEQAKATSRVVSSSRGIVGITDDLNQLETSREEAGYNYSVLRNQQLANISTAIGFENSALRSRSNLLRINQPIPQPNYLGTAISGLGLGLDMHSSLTSAGIVDADNNFNFNALNPFSGRQSSSTPPPPAFSPFSSFNMPQPNYTPFTAPTTFRP